MNTSRFVSSLVVGLALGAFGTCGLAAQAGPPAKGASTHMVVTEEASQDSNVPVISPSEVVVSEAGERDNVTGWVAAQGEHAGLEFFILLDDDSTTSLGTQLRDIREFINGQPSSTKIGIAYMRNGIAWIQQKPTSDHALAAKALRLPLGIAGANGSPYFSLSDLVKRWPKSDSRREVLMISDGVDRYYDGNDLLDPYLAKTIKDVQRAGVVVSVIYTPGIGGYGRSAWQTYLGQVYMTQVASETGGQSYYIGFNEPAVAFAPYLHDLANRLNHQYLLSFLAGPQKKAGLEPVKLIAEVPNVNLVSADRVYVPAKR
ncbi:MAG: hypothetical protein WBM04_06045 [Candidatus Korobacteraceae bacterium]